MIFDLGEISEWQSLAKDAHVLVPSDKPKTVKFDVLLPKDGDVEARWVAPDGEEKSMVVASGHGLLSVRLVIEADTMFFARQTKMHYRIFGRSHIVEQTSDEKYTSLENRKQRNPELERMLQVTRINEMRREARLSEEIAKLRELQNAAIDAGTTKA